MCIGNCKRTFCVQTRLSTGPTFRQRSPGERVQALRALRALCCLCRGAQTSGTAPGSSLLVRGQQHSPLMAREGLAGPSFLNRMLRFGLLTASICCFKYPHHNPLQVISGLHYWDKCHRAYSFLQRDRGGRRALFYGSLLKPLPR